MVNKHNIELQYQVIQNNEGSLIFNIEQEISKNTLKLLSQEIKKYFNSDIIFTIKDKQILHQMEGKLVDFISFVNRQ